MASNILIRAACFLHRRFQKFRGRWRLLDWIEARRENLEKFRSGPVCMGHGIYLYVSFRDRFDGQKHYIHGLNLREPIINIASQIIGQGDTVVDVGANVGYFSAIASLLAGKRGKIIAFEASPRMIPRLSVLAKKNPYNNIEIVNAAVAEDVGFLRFNLGPEDHNGISSIRDLEDRLSESFQIRSVSLDSMIDAFSTIKLVKIDVEGAEMKVLRGMQKIISRDRPYIIAEITDEFLRSLGSNKFELVSFVENLGYESFRIGRDTSEYVHLDELQCDVLFVPKERASVRFDHGREDFFGHLKMPGRSADVGVVES